MAFQYQSFSAKTGVVSGELGIANNNLINYSNKMHVPINDISSEYSTVSQVLYDYEIVKGLIQVAKEKKMSLKRLIIVVFWHSWGIGSKIK